jgi:hypothetical protein
MANIGEMKLKISLDGVDEFRQQLNELRKELDATRKLFGWKYRVWRLWHEIIKVRIEPARDNMAGQDTAG